MKPCLDCEKKDKCRVLCKAYLDWIFDDKVETVLTDEEKKVAKYNTRFGEKNK